MNLGVMMAGGAGKRHPEDFYATPREATVALIEAVGRLMGPVVHEPSCGAGAMAIVLAEYGFKVISTDLIDRGFGQSGIDYLQDCNRARTVISNPPFKLAAEFIEHGMAQDPVFFAMLLKSTFWNASKRIGLFERFPPKLTLPLTWRLDFTNQGSPTMECTWFVWGSAIPSPQPPMLLRRPAAQSAGVFA